MNDDNIVFNGLNIGFIGFAECSEGLSTDYPLSCFESEGDRADMGATLV